MSAREFYARTPAWEQDLLIEHLYAELAPDDTASHSRTPAAPRGAESPFAAPPDLKGL